MTYLEFELGLMSQLGCVVDFFITATSDMNSIDDVITWKKFLLSISLSTRTTIATSRNLNFFNFLQTFERQ